MLDIIGNLKIDETKPERIKYLIACIRSYGFLKDTCRFVLNLQGASEELLEIVKNELKGFDAYLSADLDPDYGNVYIQLTTKGWAHKHNYILNFMEDHFCVLDSKAGMHDVLGKMQRLGADVFKASFFGIENKSIDNLPINSGKITFNFHDGYAMFHNTEYFHKCYQAHYGSRYYIGVNFIVSRAFASKFWRYSHGQRPHDYEIPRYNKDLEHNVMFPAYEITCSIDDDHGEPNTCLLNRTDCQKWNIIWKQVNAEYGNDPLSAIKKDSETDKDEVRKGDIVELIGEGRLIEEEETRKLLDATVFPSDQKTISVKDDDAYGGAHEYFVSECKGFSNGKTEYSCQFVPITFLKKLDDGTMVPGLQSEQLVYLLIDRHEKLNKRFPSPQNEKALAGLRMFIEACEERVKDRMDRGVMGELKK